LLHLNWYQTLIQVLENRNGYYVHKGVRALVVKMATLSHDAVTYICIWETTWIELDAW
jgi:hypothetical protein